MGYLPDPPDHDPITGRALTGHEDEPVRVVLERHLMGLGYAAEDIRVEPMAEHQFEGEAVTVKCDLLVVRGGRAAMVVRCAPGSLQSRIQETIARARLIAEAWVPLAVTTNGVDARLIDVAENKELARGMESIPAPADLDRLLAERSPHAPAPDQTEKALRVYLAYAAFKCPTDCVF